MPHVHTTWHELVRSQDWDRQSVCCQSQPWDKTGAGCTRALCTGSSSLLCMELRPPRTSPIIWALISGNLFLIPGPRLPGSVRCFAPWEMQDKAVNLSSHGEPCSCPWPGILTTSWASLKASWNQQGAAHTELHHKAVSLQTWRSCQVTPTLQLASGCMVGTLPYVQFKVQ